MERVIMGLEVEYGSIPNNSVYSARFLTNGGNLYTDIGGHLEYCTPEVTNPLDALHYYNAGDIIIKRETQGFGLENIFKNNTDGRVTHGCHESYLMKRVSDWEYTGRVAGLMIPFLVTRQIFAGAGKVSRSHPFFHLSQRAPFINQPTSNDSTTQNRAIFNLRDEPLADPEVYRRMHAIIGDANMSQVSTYLKVGTTALVVRLVDEGLKPFVELDDPVQALKYLSQDYELIWIVKTASRKTISAIDIQRLYLEKAKKYRRSDEVTDDVLDRWEGTLDKLERRDPRKYLGKELDWAIKLRKCLELMEAEGMGWEDPEVRDLDLFYHEVGNDSIFSGWERRGDVVTVAFVGEIERASKHPPEDTRAWIRGEWIKRFGILKNMSQRDWCILVTPEGKRIGIGNPFDNYANLLND